MRGKISGSVSACKREHITAACIHQEKQKDHIKAKKEHMKRSIFVAPSVLKLVISVLKVEIYETKHIQGRNKERVKGTYRAGGLERAKKHKGHSLVPPVA